MAQTKDVMFSWARYESASSGKLHADRMKWIKGQCNRKSKLKGDITDKVDKRRI